MARKGQQLYAVSICIVILCILSQLQFNLGRKKMRRRYKKKHLPDTGGRRKKTINSEYYSHFSEIEGGSSDVVCKDDVPRTPITETMTIIEQDDESVSG